MTSQIKQEQTIYQPARAAHIAALTKTQTELTKEQEKLCDAIAERYIANLHRGSGVAIEAITPALELVYSYYNLALPEIELCGSPAAALRRAKELGIDNPDFDYLGANDSGWLARYDAFYQLGALEESEVVDLKKLIALYFGGVYDTILCDERALIVRFPDDVRVDNEGNLHNPAGPCIRWCNGETDYAWHGTWVPKQWIEDPSSVDPATALTHQNIEERRACAEIIGWRRVLESPSLRVKVINKDEDPEIGELLEVDLPDAGAARFLKVKCGTGRDFVLSVPLEMKTAAQANAWGFNISEKELRQSEIRT